LLAIGAWMLVDQQHRRARVRFSRLIEDAKTRVEVIVTFLAVLEMIKRMQIRVEQERLFGEIVLVRRAAIRNFPRRTCGGLYHRLIDPKR